MSVRLRSSARWRPRSRRFLMTCWPSSGTTTVVVMISVVLFEEIWHPDAPDYADAHALMLTLLDKLRRIDLDHPDTQKAIELIKFAFGSK